MLDGKTEEPVCKRSPSWRRPVALGENEKGGLWWWSVVGAYATPYVENVSDHKQTTKGKN